MQAIKTILNHSQLIQFMEGIKQIAYKYAIKNAYEYEGKAQPGAVIGKVKALFPEADLKKIAPEVAKIVAQINKMKKEEISKEYAEFEKQGWELKHTEKEKTLQEMDWVKPAMKIITRVAPNPSGVMHFGHARPAVLTDEYAKRYNAKYILRFDDTDPKTKTPMEGAEAEFKHDFAWLGIKFDETCRSSDRLERYYEVLEKLLADGTAYICNCESEKWRKLIWAKKACSCRGKKPGEQLTLWKKMLSHEIKEEQAVVRIKTDLKNPDPSERDWWAAKVVDEINHTNPQVKGKHVWPSYNLACAVDDHDMGINLVIRGQEHLTNGDKQKFIFDHFGWEFPHCYYNGKVSKLGDMVLSKSKIKVLMEKQGLTRDDDPRLATIKAFRRRGFVPQAIRKIILDCGLSLKEVKIPMEMIAAANKQFIGEVNDYPFFEEAAQIEVYNAAPGEGDCYGEKVSFEAGIAKLFVDKKELLKYKGKKDSIVRFKKAFNAKINEAGEYEGKATFISYSKTDYPILNWATELVDVEVLMSDGKTKRGFSCPTLLEAKGMVRLEGLGYANIEAKENGVIKLVYAYE
jgi:glutamyl-tRNA synthetase